MPDWLACIAFPVMEHGVSRNAIMANPNTISGSPAPWRTCEQHPYAGLVFRTPAPNDHPQLATVIQKSFTAGIFAKTILAFQAE